MKRMTCEMCGSTDLMKEDGVFVCQSCGTKYSVEEAKKMMIVGPVDIQGTVKVDASDKVKNLYKMARRAKNDNNAELAAKYYEMITFEDPDDWESSFYLNYFKTRGTNLKNMRNSVIRLANSLDSIFNLVSNSGKTADEKWNITREIVVRIDILCDDYLVWAKSHYRKFSSVRGSESELEDRAFAIAELQRKMADLLEKHFPEESAQVVVSYLKSYVQNYLLLDTLGKDDLDLKLKYFSDDLMKAEERIKKLEPSYIPLVNNTTGSSNDVNNTTGSSNDVNNTNGTNVFSKTYAKGGMVIGGIIGAIGNIIIMYSKQLPFFPALILFAFITYFEVMIGGPIGKAIKKE